MAVENSPSGHAPMDEKAHVATYSGFIGMLKWGSIAVAVIVALVMLLIAG